jgi:uncharacterized protein
MAERGIGWIDLTADDAEGLRGFYTAVTGLEADAVSMGDYDDYALRIPGGDPVAGVCHRRGENVGAPSGWMIYFNVPDIAVAIAAATEAGGELLHGPSGGESFGHMAFLKDPAGNRFALYQSSSD